VEVGGRGRQTIFGAGKEKRDTAVKRGSQRSSLLGRSGCPESPGGKASWVSEVASGEGRLGGENAGHMGDARRAGGRASRGIPSITAGTSESCPKNNEGQFIQREGH